MALSGQGIIDLLPIMQGAIKPTPAATMNSELACPECHCSLTPIHNVGRVGRFRQLNCSNESCKGYSQTFMSFLAEKGFVRKVRWLDIHQWLAKGTHVVYTSCGINLDNRPQQNCPYCQSPIAVLDPAGFATVVDIRLAATEDKLEIRPLQNRCRSCGGPVDHEQDVSCPHCSSTVSGVDTELIQLISAAVKGAECTPRQVLPPEPHAQPEPWDHFRMPGFTHHAPGNFLNGMSVRTHLIIALCIGLLSVVTVLLIEHS